MQRRKFLALPLILSLHYTVACGTSDEAPETRTTSVVRREPTSVYEMLGTDGQHLGTVATYADKLSADGKYMTFDIVVCSKTRLRDADPEYRRHIFDEVIKSQIKEDRTLTRQPLLEGKYDQVQKCYTYNTTSLSKIGD